MPQGARSGDARDALSFYQTVFGGHLVVVTYQDAHSVTALDEADQVMWGQVTSDEGFRVMAYDVPANTSWEPGVNPAFISVRGADATEIAAYWSRLSEGATTIAPLAPAPWAPLYGAKRRCSQSAPPSPGS